MDALAETRRQFEAELNRESGLDLGRAAMALGLIEQPGLPLAAEHARLDALAAEITAELPHDLAPRAAAAALRGALAERRGFRGDTDSYDDPRNCFLHDALERRRAMPIVLTVLYMAAGARCGMRIAGIGLPWHFVARAGDEQAGYCYIDPFAGGATIEVEEIRGFLARRGLDAGGRLDLWLAAVTPRQILTRMLLNIKRVYLERHDDPRARAAVDLLLALTPWALEEIRDRGLLSARLGDDEQARRDLESYLERAADAPDAAQVQRIARGLRRS